MEEPTRYHTKEENQKKHDAIDDAVRDLAFNYIHGVLASNREVLYHRIDSITALLTDLRRG